MTPKQNYLQFIFIGLLLLLNSGCSVIQIDYNTPTTRFISPETKGSTFKGQVGFNVSSAQRVELVRLSNSAILGEFIDTNTSLSSADTTGGQIDVGILKRVDVSVSKASDALALFGVKYQFIGSPENDKSKGLKAAVAFRYGEENSEETRYDYEDTPFKCHLKSRQSDFDLIVGYRLDPKHLFYTTAYHNLISAKGRIESSEGPTIYNDDTSRDSGFLLGYRFSAKKNGLFLMLEYGINTLKLNSGDKRQAEVSGISCGLNW